MNCEDAQQRWHDSWDDEADYPDLQAHLKSCASCRKYAQQSERVVRALDTLRTCTESVGSTTANTLLGNGKVRSAKRWRTPARWISGLAATIALCFWVSQFHRTAPQQERKVGSVHGQTLGLALEGESSKRFMVVARPATDPNVQLFWLYPSLVEQ